MKLVREIRDGVVDPTISLSTVLRKAKILSVSLGNQEFRKWVDYELNGYSGDVELPSYRKLNIPVLGNFSGTFGRSVTGYLLPVAFMPDTFKKMAKEVMFGNPIKEIEPSLAATGKEGLRFPWPTEAVILMRDTIKLTGGFELISKAKLCNQLGPPAQLGNQKNLGLLINLHHGGNQSGGVWMPAAPLIGGWHRKPL